MLKYKFCCVQLWYNEITFILLQEEGTIVPEMFYVTSAFLFKFEIWLSIIIVGKNIVINIE